MARADVHVPDLSAGHCRGLGDLFYPEGIGRQDIIRAAIRVCRLCPLIHPCREYAETAREQFGVWGGRDFDAAHRSNAGWRNRQTITTERKRS